MKQKRRLMVFIILTINVLVVIKASASLAEDIAVVQIVNNGPQVLINLDYDLESTPGRGETKSLVVLVLFTLPNDNNPVVMKGSILFFRTNMGENLLFWTLNDPFDINSAWYLGYENSHYQTSYHELLLTLIEFTEHNNPELGIDVLAKNLAIGEVNSDMNDFGEIFEFFLLDLPSYYEVSTTIGSTTTTTSLSQTPTSETTSSLISGFQLIASFGIMLVIVLRKKKEKPD